MNNKFVGHKACPLCGSRDNVMVYSDGYEFCNTPNCGYFVKSETALTHDVQGNIQSKNNKNFIYDEGEIPRFLTKARNFTYAALKEYRLSLRSYKGLTVLSFPLYENGMVVGCKNRTVIDPLSQIVWQDKQYFFEGDAKSLGLFGLHTIDSTKKKLIITEGELDAVAAWIMYGMKYNVVSILHGCKSVKNDLQKHLDLFDSHDEIILCLDNDREGQIAAKTGLKAFAPGKAKNCILPQEFKDACELLKEDEGGLFRTAIHSAQHITISGFVDKQEGIDRTIKYLLNIDNTRNFFTTGYKTLDNLCGGFRSGEIFTLVGGTGIGKSSISFNFTVKALKQEKQTLFLPFEMGYEIVCSRLLEIYLKEKLITVDNKKITIPEVDLRNKLEILTDTLHVHDQCGGMPVKKLINVIEFYCRVYGIDLIILDHIHAAVNNSGIESQAREVQIIDSLVAELKRIAVNLNCCILLVSHQSKSSTDPFDNKTNLSRIRGSAGIGQNSDLVLGVSRDRNSTITKITTLKSHRLFGVHGEIFLEFNPETLNYTEQNVQFKQKELTDMFNRGNSFQEPLRNADLSRESGPDLRTNEIQILPTIHSRLSTANEDGQTNIHREQGFSRQHGSQQTEASAGTKSFYRLEDLIKTRQLYIKQEKKIFDLW